MANARRKAGSARPVNIRDTPRWPGSAPRLPRIYVDRHRLWDRLEEATQNPLTLLVAPVGAGKTLGVSGWLHHTGRTGRVAWVSADASWDRTRMGRLLDTATRDAEHGSVPELIVVDDAHQLPQATLRLLDERLNAAPLDQRVLLLSRWDLPLTRLVPELLGHFTVVRGEVLRMDGAESAALITEHAGTDAPEVLEAVTTHAQGWCAAVVLTARAIAAAPDPVAAARAYGDGGATVADRVASEVFATLHPRERHQLLCVASEETVTAATAAHLSHDSRAGEILADVEMTGLLVTRLSPEVDEADHAPADSAHAARYHIHPLLSEVVRRRLLAGGVDVAQAQSTVLRAVRLDLARGDPTRAFPRLVATNQPMAAAEVLVEEGPAMVLRGQGPSIFAFARRHPSALEAAPGAWFTLALERWVNGDPSGATHWLDRIIENQDEGPDDKPSPRLACVRLMRARLGEGAAADAVERATHAAGIEHREPAAQVLLPILLTELGAAQNWLGELNGAEISLTTAVRLARTRDLPALVTVALSHLAFTQFLLGRERACVQVANEAFESLLAQRWEPVVARTRARIAHHLASLCDLPWPDEPEKSAAEDLVVHVGDPLSRFWSRIRGSRIALMRGGLSEAEQVLETSIETPALSRHLRVVVLVERAFLASLSGDPRTLTKLEAELGDVDAPGEAALVAGLRADLVGDRRQAAAHFAAAAAADTFPQPPSRALALTCEAQMLDVLGDEEAALARLQEAATMTEVRRNAVPFLGWTRHGTPLESLMGRLAERVTTPWVQDLAAAGAGRPDFATFFGPTTATPRENSAPPSTLVRPTLSPRERDVLNELARGSTYADIAANLFVSENTIKTHVSSLYGKLSAGRRSEALAVARKMHLL